MKAPTFLGKVKDGKITWDKPELIKLWENSLPDGYVVGTIKPKKATRSDRQRKYYFGVIVQELALHLGISKEEANEFCKWWFNPTIITVKGDEVRIGGSIEAETTDRVEEINKNIREWASAELGLWIGEPNEAEDGYSGDSMVH